MKKLIVVVLTLVLVLAGVSSAMAYEAHKVNVKAHVENALVISTKEIDMGTVFPQEWVTGFHFDVKLSASFLEQRPVRVDVVDYMICAHHKVLEDGTRIPWLPGLYVKVDDGDWMPVIEPDEFCMYTRVGPGQLTLADADNMIHLGLDVPVFNGYINEALEDYLQIVKPRPWGGNDPSGYLDPPAAGPDVGADYGVDLWIQVTGISAT